MLRNNPNRKAIIVIFFACLLMLAGLICFSKAIFGPHFIIYFVGSYVLIITSLLLSYIATSMEARDSALKTEQLVNLANKIEKILVEIKKKNS